MVGIIDYNIGNLASVYNACHVLDAKAQIVKNPEQLKNFDKVILPGVGAYGDAMDHLRQTGMLEAVKEYANTGKAMLGICLGMQLLLEKSEEFGEHEGIGLIPGEVIHFDKSKMDMENHKIPHVGWNKIFTKENQIFDGLDNPYLYFVHSYHAVTDDKYAIGTTHYGYDFTSAINKDNIYGFQPHPEKSHENGLKILSNFFELKL